MNTKKMSEEEQRKELEEDLMEEEIDRRKGRKPLSRK